MTREEEIKHVFQTKDVIISRKKSALKKGDNVINQFISDEKKTANKASVDLSIDDPKVLTAKLVINTTNVIDSHMDCHIPGIWDKSLKEIGLFYLLQEHKMDFKYIISDSKKDSLTASAVNVKWSELGYSYKGDTQALIFTTSISKERNEFMFEQYKKGYVMNHSVGMQYVKLFLCIDSNEADYSSEKSNWDKYYPQVANKEVADQKGYFWAVTEAKIVEGSAVVKGSNQYTPVMEIEIEKEIEAVNDDTLINEPSNDTQKRNINHLFI